MNADPLQRRADEIHERDRSFDRLAVVSVVDRLGYERCLHCAAAAGILFPALEDGVYTYPVAVHADSLDDTTDLCETCRTRIVPEDASAAAELAERADAAVQAAPTQDEREAFQRLAHWYWSQT